MKPKLKVANSTGLKTYLSGAETGGFAAVTNLVRNPTVSTLSQVQIGASALIRTNSHLRNDKEKRISIAYALILTDNQMFTIMRVVVTVGD